MTWLSDSLAGKGWRHGGRLPRATAARRTAPANVAALLRRVVTLLVRQVLLATSDCDALAEGVSRQCGEPGVFMGPVYQQPQGGGTWQHWCVWARRSSALLSGAWGPLLGPLREVPCLRHTTQKKSPAAGQHRKLC